MLANLIDSCIRLILRMPFVSRPVESNSLAPLARTNLPEHDISNPQLLKLILTIRLIILLVNYEAGPENVYVGVYLREHLSIIAILVVHCHSQLVN